MRGPVRLSAPILLAAWLAAPAAWSLAYSGTLVLNVGTLDPLIARGSGDGVSTPSSVVIGPGAILLTSVVIPVDAFPIVELQLTGPVGLDSASFAAGAAPDGGFGGDAALAGNARVGLFGPPPFAFLTVPLSPVGVEDATATVSSVGGVSITVFGGGWSTGPAQVVGTFGPFDGQLLARATGADGRTAGGAGAIALVAPALVRTNIGGSENLPVLATLTLSFVPDPNTLLLLASGLFGLALHGRRRGARARVQPRR